MADITYTNEATELRQSPKIVPGKGNANVLQSVVSATIELATSASGDTVFLGRISSNTRILASSRVYNDDLATSGSPTLDIGLGSVDSNITSDPDALTNGIALSAAGSDTLGISDIANAGKRAWEFVSGQTEDPGGSLDVFATVKDAVTNAAGTITVEYYGTFD